MFRNHALGLKTYHSLWAMEIRHILRETTWEWETEKAPNPSCHEKRQPIHRCSLM